MAPRKAKAAKKATAVKPKVVKPKEVKAKVVKAKEVKPKVVKAPEPSIQAGAETETAEVKAVAHPRKGIVVIPSLLPMGCLMLLVGDYEDKGEDIDYWRVRLGWSGEEKPRKVYYRYEAVGDPTQTGDDGQVPELRFVWLFETGEWADKGAIMRERALKAQKEEEERQAAIDAAEEGEKLGRGARRGRAARAAPDVTPGAGRQDSKGTTVEGLVEGEDSASHSPPETVVKGRRKGKTPAVAKPRSKRKRGGDDDNEPAGPAKKRATRKARA
ncbi:uncharacterized protein GIQ15_01097 [Arthroderma uncinatum]|uniref:uncharacterized protein n=1 Tax=Arthroderma uncinatum TaxID=74035 RepID=UPI00144A8D02|nr:uncharacterized protein GIQ15_01097 [Arthroderma uncinatum]KAF3491580.1 hypothetical protein GIQ15_01097 [Arthroderma uncinatum]